MERDVEIRVVERVDDLMSRCGEPLFLPTAYALPSPSRQVL